MQVTGTQVNFHTSTSDGLARAAALVDLTASFEPEAWIHLILVSDGAEFKLYINE